MATATERKKLTAEQFLAENKVHSLLEHVTAELLQFTPNDPLSFLCRRIEEIQTQGKWTETRPRVISVLGGPASGKAVQVANLAQELGVICIAPPELIRDEIKEGTDIGKQVGDMLHKNVVVPKEIVTELVKKRIQHHLLAHANSDVIFALDGYPRTIDQALHFEKEVTEISVVVYLKCDDSTLLERMASRAQHTGQEDDREPHASAKIQFFHTHTVPAIEYFQAMGKLVVVPGDKSMSEVGHAVEKGCGVR